MLPFLPVASPFNSMSAPCSNRNVGSMLEMIPWCWNECVDDALETSESSVTWAHFQMKEQRLRAQVKAPWNPDESEAQNQRTVTLKWPRVCSVLISCQDVWFLPAVPFGLECFHSRCSIVCQYVELSLVIPHLRLMCPRKNSIYWLQQRVGQSVVCFTFWPVHLQSYTVKGIVWHFGKYPFFVTLLCQQVIGLA